MAEDAHYGHWNSTTTVGGFVGGSAGFAASTAGFALLSNPLGMGALGVGVASTGTAVATTAASGITLAVALPIIASVILGTFLGVALARHFEKRSAKQEITTSQTASRQTVTISAPALSHSPAQSAAPQVGWARKVEQVKNDAAAVSSRSV